MFFLIFFSAAGYLQESEIQCLFLLGKRTELFTLVFTFHFRINCSKYSHLPNTHSNSMHLRNSKQRNFFPASIVSSNFNLPPRFNITSENTERDKKTTTSSPFIFKKFFLLYCHKSTFMITYAKVRGIRQFKQ